MWDECTAGTCPTASGEVADRWRHEAPCDQPSAAKLCQQPPRLAWQPVTRKKANEMLGKVPHRSSTCKNFPSSTLSSSSLRKERAFEECVQFHILFHHSLTSSVINFSHLSNHPPLSARIARTFFLRN